MCDTETEACVLFKEGIEAFNVLMFALDNQVFDAVTLHQFCCFNVFQVVIVHVLLDHLYQDFSAS